MAEYIIWYFRRIINSLSDIFYNLEIDPHFKTFTKDAFSYHGQCDMVLARLVNNVASSAGPTGGLEVHIRTTRVSSPRIDYSYISGAAVRIGTDVLEITEDGLLMKNLDVMLLDDGSETSFAGYTLKKNLKGAKKLIVVHDFDLGDDKKIQVRSNTKNGMVFVDVSGDFEDVEGLLGTSIGQGQEKKLLSRDRVTDMTGHWNSYGEEWQVNDNDPKLFKDSTRHPQFPNGCEYKADPMSQLRHRRRRRLLADDEMMMSVTVEDATKACAHLKEEGGIKDFCINDILVTGDLDLAEDTFYHSD
jgi:hypothetical protein